MKEQTYRRYTSPFQEERANTPERRQFEQQVLEDFRSLYVDGQERNLNVKVKREDFNDLLNGIGVQLQSFARQVADRPEEHPKLSAQLKEHPVPVSARGIMTDEFRVFCLALNALKQWLAAEQAAMDRVILGSEYKKKLNRVFTTCVETGERLDFATKGRVNYHHPMRDGRFPIPLSKERHDKIEGQAPSKG